MVRHRLPTAFAETAGQFYAPFVESLAAVRPDDSPLVLGISGAQGTGKTTLADYAVRAVVEIHGWHAVGFSIDDFYLTKAERAQLAADVHPLLTTRGVPGTHDVGLLGATLDALLASRSNEDVCIPRFDKALDDRAPEPEWSVVNRPVDLIVLEGWCVGSRPQTPDQLCLPMNALERTEDPDGVWRRYVNDRLAGDYQVIFAQIDTLAFLQAPSFDAVYRWRLEQEQKLADARGGAALMSPGDLRRFIQHYQRITAHNLETLPGAADVTFRLDEVHDVISMTAQRRDLE